MTKSRWIGEAPFGDWYREIDYQTKNGGWVRASGRMMHWRERRMNSRDGYMVYLGHGHGWEWTENPRDP